MERTVRLIAWGAGCVAFGWTLQEAMPAHRLVEIVTSALPF